VDTQSALGSSASVTCRYLVTQRHDIPLPSRSVRSQHVTTSTQVRLRAKCMLHRAPRRADTCPTTPNPCPCPNRTAHKGQAAGHGGMLLMCRPAPDPTRPTPARAQVGCASGTTCAGQAADMVACPVCADPCPLHANGTTCEGQAAHTAAHPSCADPHLAPRPTPASSPLLCIDLDKKSFNSYVI
jgi:hypothetical protein